MRKGIFSEKQVRKATEEDKERMVRKAKKAKLIQLQCNHYDASNGKDALKPRGNMSVCKVCDGKVINDRKILNSKSVTEAWDLVESAIAVIRHENPLTKEIDTAWYKAAITLHQIGAILEEMEDANKNKKSKKKEHDHKGKDHDKKKGVKRVKY